MSPSLKWLSESWLEMASHIDTYGSPNKGLFLFISIKPANLVAKSENLAYYG